MDEQLQAICVRLDRQLIEELKFIARYRGARYQPMIRETLTTYAQRELLDIVLQMRTELASVSASSELMK
jgi:hypothetical protein